jgi:hypothetical protein
MNVICNPWKMIVTLMPLAPFIMFAPMYFVLTHTNYLIGGYAKYIIGRYVSHDLITPHNFKY